MKQLFLRVLAFAGAAGVLAACAGPAQEAQTIGMSERSVGAGALSRSWMQPGAASGNLLYVSYPDNNFVTVYSYPAGTQVGQLANLPSEPFGLCSDKKGNVWLTMLGLIYEYAHGGTTPIATLSDGQFYAGACSVDPSTGNLAVANWDSPSSRNGNLAIYRGGREPRKIYKQPLFLTFLSCGYDPSGNLYVTGYGKNSFANLFAELPKGAGALKTITLSHTPQGQADVQWDGQNVAVSSPEEGMIMRFKISGALGKEVGFTTFYDFNTVQQFTFPNVAARHGKLAGRVIGTSTQFGEVMYWNYPQGGNPTFTIPGDTDALSATVSLAPHR